MSRLIMQQALDALDNHNGNYALTKQECADINKVCDNLRQELAKPEQAKYSDIVSDGGLDPRNKFDAQPEQEPVAVWELQSDGWDTIADTDWMESLPVGTKLYTAPPRKEWVGLTDEEIKGILDCGRGGLVDIKKAEQILKEKNT